MSEQETNQTERERKNVIINLTTNEVVDLLIEWAEITGLPEWLDKMMEDIQARSFSDHPATEEEKISFISAFAYSMPHDSLLKNVVLRFLKNYEASEE